MALPVRGCPEHKVPLDEAEVRRSRGWTLRCPMGHDTASWVVLDGETGKVLEGATLEAVEDLEHQPPGEPVQFPLNTTVRYARRKTHGLAPDDEDEHEDEEN